MGVGGSEGAIRRKEERIAALQLLLDGNPPELREMLLARYCLAIGVSDQKLKEYLRLIQAR